MLARAENREILFCKRRENVMKDVLKSLKAVFLSNWSPLEKSLLLLDVLLTGVLLGWLTSPMRKVVINADCDIENEEEEE